MCNYCNCGTCGCNGSLWNWGRQSICRDACGNIRVTNSGCGCQNSCGCQNGCGCSNDAVSTTNTTSSCAANSTCGNTANSNYDWYYARQYGLLGYGGCPCGSGYTYDTVTQTMT